VAKPPIVKAPAPGSPEVPKIPTAPVQRPIDIPIVSKAPVEQPKQPAPPVMPPILVNEPAKLPPTSPLPQPVDGTLNTGTSGGDGGDRPKAPVPGSVEPTAPPPSGTSPAGSNDQSATTLSYSGSFYSVRVGVSVNGTLAEVIYASTSSNAGALCSSSRYVLHLNMANAANAAFVNTIPPASTYQTVNIRCPSAPLLSSSTATTAPNAKVISYPQVALWIQR